MDLFKKADDLIDAKAPDAVKAQAHQAVDDAR